jgi:hydrogenase maturation protease
MNSDRLNELVHALLYEGYILYPYRASSVKNQRERFTFGRVYPRAYSEAQKGAEPARMRTECLLKTHPGEPKLEISIRFLQPVRREVGVLAKPADDWNPEIEPEFAIAPELRVGERVYRPWLEAVEREVARSTVFSPACARVQGKGLAGETPALPGFEFLATRTLEPIRDDRGRIVGVLIRTTEPVHGNIETIVESLTPTSFKAVVIIENLSSMANGDLNDPDAVLLRTFASTHTILHTTNAEFISLMDPPPCFKEAAASCRNLGTWPVLVGDETKQERDMLLSSPIILYDYPKLSAQSRGDLFDSTEIDELLTLRVLTMTDEEKREMRDVEGTARRLLDRTEALPQEDLLRMHGTRSFDEEIFGSNTRLDRAAWKETYLQCGQRVRIRPKARADVLDLALAGRTAVIEAVEQDAEKKIHLALVLEEDPGKDLGWLRQPGHRFFYGLDEVEPLEVA